MDLEPGIKEHDIKKLTEQERTYKCLMTGLFSIIDHYEDLKKMMLSVQNDIDLILQRLPDPEDPEANKI